MYISNENSFIIIATLHIGTVKHYTHLHN